MFTSSAAADYIVNITSPADSEIISGMVTIEGTLDLNGEQEPDGISVQINGTWRNAVETGNGTNWSAWEYVWRSGRVENGPLNIRAAARDGFDYEGTTSIAVTVNNNPPVAEITRTQPNSSVVGRIVTLHGIASDLGSGSAVATYLWESDIDGAIGYTKNLTAFLSEGDHYITFRIENDIGMWSDPVHVNVTIAPGEIWTLQGGDLTNSGSGGQVFDLRDIEPGWFYATGERDGLRNVVPATGEVITGSVVAGEMVYAVLENGTVLAFDSRGLFDGVQGEMLDSADILWAVHLEELTTGGSILYHEDVLYVGTEAGNLHALNASSGAHDVWEEGSKRWVGGAIGHNAFTIVEDYLVFGSYDDQDSTGEVWSFDIADGDMVEVIQTDKRPIQKPVPVGDYLLQPIYAKNDGILVFDINRKGELIDMGRLEMPHYVMGVSAADGLLTIVTRPSTSNTTGTIYLYTYGLEMVAEYSSDLEYYNPAAISDGRILVAGVFHERYGGGVSPYIYERGYIQVFDDDLVLVDELEIDGTPSYQPTILGDTVLISTFNGSLYAYDIPTGTPIDGWPIDYSEYGRGTSNQTFSTSQIIPFSDALAFGSFDSVFYTLGGEVIKPIAKVIEVTTHEGEGLETWNGTRSTFRGEGSSLAGREIISHRWTSDIDGLIGQSDEFRAKLSQGEHQISFQVTDDENLTSIPVNFTYTVRNNSLPIAKITNLGSIGKVDAGDPLFIYLSHSFDPDDPDEEITFRVDYGEGVNWTVAGIVADNVWEKPGTYNVNITPYDTHGVAGETISVTVQVVEPDEKASEFSIMLILGIVIMIIVIIALAGLFVAVRKRAPEAVEDEPPADEAEEKAPEEPEAPPAKGPPMITPPPDAIEGEGPEDVSFDELAKRVQVLIDHRKELEDELIKE